MKRIFNCLLLAIALSLGAKALYHYYQTRSISPTGEYIVKYNIQEWWWKNSTVCTVFAKQTADSEYQEERVPTRKKEMMDAKVEWIADNECTVKLYLNNHFEAGVIVVFLKEEIEFNYIQA